MANNLILRSVSSPYGDETRGSVLSHQDVDNNFIFLKGDLINSAQLINNNLLLTKINGEQISVELNISDGGGTTITGGTYDNITGEIVFTNTTGGTFSVSGFFKPSDDLYTTGLTFNIGNYDLTLNRSDGTNFTQSLAILSSDMTITGGTYDSGTGVGTFTNNSGGTFQVSGFLTGYTDTNIYNADGFLSANRTLNLSGNTLTFKQGSSGITETILNATDSSNRGLFQIRSQYFLDTNTFGPYTGDTASIYIGLNAGMSATGSNLNTVVGSNALRSLASGGSGQVAIGSDALRGLTGGCCNTAIGDMAGGSLRSGGDNIFIGQRAARLFTGGTANVLIGANVVDQSLSGSNNVMIGKTAGNRVTGDNNVMIGREAGGSNTPRTSTGNVFLGYQAGSSEVGSNLLYIENSNSSSPLIYGDFANDLLRFNAKVGVNVLPSTFQFDVNGTSRLNGDTIIGGLNNGFTLANSRIFFRATATSGFGLSFNPWNVIDTANQDISGISIMDGVYGQVSYTFGTNTFNNLSITPTIGTSGGTNLVRGVYFAPNIINLTGTTIVGFQNTVGNNLFNSISGNTLIGTTTDSGNKLVVSASSNPIRVIGLQESADTRVVTSSTNGVLSYMELGDITGATKLYWYAENNIPPLNTPIASGTGSIALGEGAEALSNDMFVYGSFAGLYATNASNSNFLGYYAGQYATNAFYSNFIGYQAGYQATAANSSNFIGYQAGYQATAANSSNFIGNNAGYGATDVYDSNFIGNNAGYGATNASNSNFFGSLAGYQATNANNSNFLGSGAGYQATDANNSNFFGTLVGYQATNAYNSNFLGSGAGYQATDANNSNFFGASAGYQATNAYVSNFLGYNAGYQATDANNSNFLGNFAGYQATGASNSNFIGTSAGFSATDAYSSNFFGPAAGSLATNANQSNFFGNGSGQQATGASYSNFFGYGVGQGATGASYSSLIGFQVGKSYPSNNIGSNNIIIGTNISLPNGTTNSLNIGGILFGTNTYSTTTGDPSINPNSSGKIGVGVVSPLSKLDIDGDIRVRDGVTIYSGSNKAVGVVQLNGGTPSTVSVSNTLVNSNSIIMLTKQTNNSTGTVAISNKTTNSFTITSTSNGDTDLVAYMIINTL